MEANIGYLHTWNKFQIKVSVQLHALTTLRAEGRIIDWVTPTAQTIHCSARLYIGEECFLSN
jgi:hypothetical protein